MSNKVIKFPHSSEPGKKETREEKKRRYAYGEKLKRVQIDDGRYPDGRRKTKAFYGKTIAEAEAKRDAFLEKKKRRIPVQYDGITVGAWLDEWLKTYKTKPTEKTLATYKSIINRIKAHYIGQMKVEDVRDADVQDVINSFAGMSASYINKAANILRGSFKKARRNRVILEDPAEDIEPPDGDSGTHRCLQEWETQLILVHWKKHRVGLWAMLMLLTGIRPGEMVSLKWEDGIGLEDRKLHVKDAAEMIGNRTRDRGTTKSAAGIRSIPICDALYEALVAVPKEKRNGYVCLSAKGIQLTPSAIDRGWTGFCKMMSRINVGFEADDIGVYRRKPKNIEEQKRKEAATSSFKCDPYDLRHTFCTALFDAGVDIKTAAYYMGHADIRLTMAIYTHLTDERKNQSRAAMTDFLDKWFETTR